MEMRNCVTRDQAPQCLAEGSGGLSSLSGISKGQLFPRRNKPGAKGDATAEAHQPGLSS